MTFLKRLFLQTGIFLMCFSAFSFSAFAYDSSNSSSAFEMIICGLIGALLVGIVVAVTLISMSRTKQKSTQADHYISSQINLTDKRDMFIRKETKRLDND